MSYSGKYAAEINKAASSTGLDPYLIAAVIRAESNFNPRAVSSAGAKGLMQLMGPTAREVGVTDPFDPEQNINGGSRYLAQQINAFGSIELGLAAYNSGPANVRRYNGIPPFNETQNYVKKVMNYYNSNSAGQTGNSGNGIDLKGVLFSPLIVLGIAGAIILKG